MCVLQTTAPPAHITPAATQMDTSNAMVLAALLRSNAHTTAPPAPRPRIPAGRPGKMACTIVPQTAPQPRRPTRAAPPAALQPAASMPPLPQALSAPPALPPASPTTASGTGPVRAQPEELPPAALPLGPLAPGPRTTIVPPPADTREDTTTPGAAREGTLFAIPDPTRTPGAAQPRHVRVPPPSPKHKHSAVLRAIQEPSTSHEAKLHTPIAHGEPGQPPQTPAPSIHTPSP